MINDHAHNRTARYFQTIEPTPQEIAQKCEQIQSAWDKDRANAQRVDEAERKFKAHLRFIQFLTENTRA